MTQDYEAHSAEQFGEQRDYWWNEDFLELLAKSWRLGDRSSLLDVGCGLCHWSSLLLPYMKPGTRFVGLDYEDRWVKEAEGALFSRIDREYLSSYSFVKGDAQKLPFEDEQFDVVTCQTVLMHLPNPEQALSEMYRVVKPGGIIICVEPNNFNNYVGLDSLEESLDEEVDRYKLWSAYRRGRSALGLGNNAFGEFLLDALGRVGLQGVQGRLSDKVHPMIPPYVTREEQAWIKQLREWRELGKMFFDREDVLRLATEGGASREFVEDQLQKLEARFDRVSAAIGDGTYICGGGCLTYIGWGTKS